MQNANILTFQNTEIYELNDIKISSALPKVKTLAKSVQTTAEV